MDNTAKFIILLALGISTFAFGSWAFAFLLFYNGKQIYEPTKWIALSEMSLAIVFTILALVAIVIFSRHNLRK